jgi:hypothetical protein
MNAVADPTITDPWAGQAVYPIGTRIHLELWQDTPPPVCDELRKVPGARWIRKNWKLDLPMHAWCMLAYQHPDPVIRAVVPQLPVLRVVVPPSPKPPADPMTALYESEFRNDLLDCDQFNNYQRRGLNFAGRRNGGHFFFTPGSGKTRASLAWGLLPPVTDRNPQGLLVVTPASVRIQWAKEATDCADVRLWVSEPTLASKKTWRTPRQYLADQRAQGRRPIFIIGWEELARLYYGDDAHEGRAGKRRNNRTRLHRHWGMCPTCQAEEGSPCGNVRTHKAMRGVHDGRPAMWTSQVAVEPEKSGRHGFLKAFIDEGVISSVIWDEIQEGKSHQRFRWVRPPDADPNASYVRKDRVTRGNRAAAAQEIAESIPRRLGTTGTPASRDVLDFHGVLTLVEAGGQDPQRTMWGTHKQFGLYHCGAAPTTYGIELPDRMILRKKDSESSLAFVEQTALTSLRFRMGVVPEGHAPPPWATVAVVRESESHKDLPEKRRRVCYIPANELDKVNATDLESCLKTPPTDEDLRLPRGQEALRILTALMKTTYCARRAVEVLGQGGKVCIITSHQLLVDKMVATIKSMLPTTTIWGLHGSNSTNKERDDIRLTYLNGERGGHGLCAVGTGATIGVGLNWHDTDLGILPVVPRTPKELLQYELRWHRLGQIRPVQVLLPVALGTLDRRTISRLRGRLVEAGEALLDVGMSNTADTLFGTDTPEEMAAMLRACMADMDDREDRLDTVLNEALQAVEEDDLWL